MFFAIDIIDTPKTARKRRSGAICLSIVRYRHPIDIIDKNPPKIKNRPSPAVICFSIYFGGCRLGQALFIF